MMVNEAYRRHKTSCDAYIACVLKLMTPIIMNNLIFGTLSLVLVIHAHTYTLVKCMVASSQSDTAEISSAWLFHINDNNNKLLLLLLLLIIKS